ncbi:MAG: hypothetical protein JNN31_05600 [Dechloromonas sp.]|nr:hypothetical protein [Dechloromonas sp.]
MKKSFNKFFLAPLTVLVLTSFALAPIAEAGRGGGGHGGGGGARAGGGGGAHAGGGGNRQINNAHADARTNNVRNTSVNNVNNRNTNINSNRNVNVNVDNNRGCCNGGWDNNYHPVATAAAVTATVAVTSAVIGSMVRTVPANCVPVNYGGMIYQQCGSTWYQPQGSEYVVINPPY